MEADFPLVQKEKRLTTQTPSQRKEQTHKPAFRVAKTVVACASLAKQAARWAAEAHVLLRFRGWSDTRAAAPRTRTWPLRARLKRKRKETAAPAAGQVSDWLFPIVPTRFSQDSHLDPRAFRGTSFQLWVELWTTPSSSAPNVGRCTGNGRTRCAAAAANFLVVGHRSCAN